MPGNDSRLAAIMFSDICDFSSIMGENEVRALSMVSRHNAVLEEAVDPHGGRIIKKTGDGALMEFPSAVSALQAALAIQRSIARSNRQHAVPEHLHVRIGIHLGEIVADGDDILGDGVNVASRIEPLAEPDGICISQEILDLVCNKMAISTVHLGAKDLKNITRQVNIYKVLIDAVSAPGARARSTRTRTGLKAGLGLAAIALAIAGAGVFWAYYRDEPLAKRRIRHRQIAFLHALKDGDLTSALVYVHPNAAGKIRDTPADGRETIVENMLRKHAPAPEDVVIEEVMLDDDGESATVVMSGPSGTHREARWEKVEGAWYVMAESQTPAKATMQRIIERIGEAAQKRPPPPRRIDIPERR